MKKKDKKEKIQEMPEFYFKEFTPEESRIYEEAIQKYRDAISAGKTLMQAYESYAVADKDFESLLQADFLKIMIAEMHFGKGQPLEEVAAKLSVSPDLLKDTKKRMIQEAGVTAADEFGKEFGPLGPESND